jgi:hypothetical protein
MSVVDASFLCAAINAVIRAGVCYVRKQDGHTALLFACANGRLDVAQWLVSSAGSDARSERSDVRTAGGAVVACARSRGVGGFL